MRLILQNAYPYPHLKLSTEEHDEVCEDAGQRVLELTGVQSVQILHKMTVKFKTAKDFTKARELTGWAVWHGFTLEAPLDDEEGYAMPGVIVDTPYTMKGVRSEQTAFAGFILTEE